MTPTRPTRRRHAHGGFTLLEVLIAVAILSISLTSLLTSQMAALRATRYAQAVTSAAFLAEYQLIEIEWKVKQEELGWGETDKEFDGTFADQGWPDMKYACLVDMVEVPEYAALQRAADAAENENRPTGPGSTGMKDVGEQAFDSLGMFWPMVKEAIERSLRKVSCTVTWTDGKVTHDFTVETYWTDPAKLSQLPQAGGEVTEETEDANGAGGQGKGGTTGTGGTGTSGTGGSSGGRPTTSTGGPTGGPTTIPRGIR